jgi:protein TonB
MYAHTVLDPRVLKALGLSVALHAVAFAGWRPFAVTPPRLASFEPIEVSLIGSPAPQITAAPRPTPRPVVAPTPLPLASAAPAEASAPATPPAQPDAGDNAESDQPLVEARSDVTSLNNPKPTYPLAARRQGVQGRVVLSARVRADGGCTEVRLKKSSGHSLLDEAAQSTVRRWRFVPATRAGRAVDSWVDVPVSFRLEG